MRKRNMLTLLLFFLLLILPATVSAAGWTEEAGETYYYTAAGSKYIGGPKKIGKKKYLFSRDGALIRSQITKKNGKLYASGADGSLLTKWGRPNGSTDIYWGTKKGYLKTGLVTRSGEYYYFSAANGSMAREVWMKIKGAYYYFGADGKAYKNGTRKIGEDKYRFNTKAQRVTGVIKSGKYYYGFDKKTGKMLRGWAEFGTSRYYFTKKYGRAGTGWKTIGGKKYYFSKNGVQQTGWITIGKRRYYLDPDDDGARVSGTVVIHGKTYQFGTKGYIKAGAGKMKVEVNRQKNVVTIYEDNIPVKAMTCSTGRFNGTPAGTYVMYDKLYWWWLNGPSIGQYCSHFLSDYLFHSVPMYNSNKNPYNVSASDYNKLGQQASEGCIRLCVADAKWLFYNVPIGSTVIISDTASTPLGKPAVQKMKAGTKGADPTDDFTNPGGYDVKLR